MRTFIFAAVIAGMAAPLAASAEEMSGAEIVVIRPSDLKPTKQGIPIFKGISGQNAGAKGISMNKVVIPPGGAAKAHTQRGHETAVSRTKARLRPASGQA